MKQRRSSKRTTWRFGKRKFRRSTAPIEIKPGASARLVRNEVWCKLHTDDPGVVDVVYRLLRFRPDGYAFMTKYKEGTWDGYISLYQRRSGTFPGGLVQRVAARLNDLDVSVNVEDRSEPPLQEPQLAGGSLTNIDLRPYQLEAAQRGQDAKRGVFDAATGLGKTEIMAEMIRRLACRSLIIVASRDLAQQTIRRFQGTEREAARLSFPNADQEQLYGIVGDDIDSPGLITAALYQTLVRRLMPVCVRCGKSGELDKLVCGDYKCGGALDHTESEETRDWLATFDALHLDECHRAPAKTWWPVINAIPAYWRFGYSATPTKSDPITDLKLTASTGEICYSFKAREAIDAGYLTEPFVATVDPGFASLGDDEDTRYIDSYRDGIVEHVRRNRLIAEIAQGTAEQWGVPTLILVQWTAHGRNIRMALRQLGVRVEFVDGTDSTEKRLSIMEALRDGDLTCAISTTIFDEGVNIPEIGALILAGGGKARHKVVQRIGRGLRVVPGKDYLPVFDFWDSHATKYLVGHSRSRLRAVQEAGFAQETLTQTELMARIKNGDVRTGVE